MRKQVHLLTLATSLGIAATLLLVRGDAGGDKEPWKTLLSKENYQVLAKREADLVRELLSGKPDDAALRRAKIGSVFLAGYAKSTAPSEETQTSISTALFLAELLSKAGALEEAKSFAATLPAGKKGVGSTADAIAWKNYLSKADVMDHFSVKSKGGDGIHPDLQSNIRLKGALNGVEEKIRSLTMKELKADVLKKEAKELELMAYQCAVVGELTYYLAPAVKAGTKDPADWRKFSLQTRDAGKDLAAAAVKVDPAGVLKFSNSLNTACSQCHAVFRQ
jgi:hypothetical protein